MKSESGGILWGLFYSNCDTRELKFKCSKLSIQFLAFGEDPQHRIFMTRHRRYVIPYQIYLLTCPSRSGLEPPLIVVGRAFSKRACNASHSSILHTPSAYILW
jgi:hypothetical protein